MNKKVLLSLSVLLIAAASLFFAFTKDGFGQSTVTGKLQGFGWSDTIGWISFSSLECNANDNNIYEPGDGLPGCPTSGPAGKYGVTIVPGGNLSGFAWSEHIGWISFNETSGCPSGICQPRIEGNAMKGWVKALSADGNGWDGWISLNGIYAAPGGQTGPYGINAVTTQSGNQTITSFDGYPWGSEVVGWLTFDHNQGSAVRIITTNDPDQCLNIPGIQLTVPSTTTRDVSGNCNCINGSTNPPICDDISDLCLNIPGIQLTVPAGMTRDASSGICSVPPSDLCLNIPGIQVTVPAGMTQDAFGNCAVPPTVTACTPIINYSQPRTIVDTPLQKCSATWNITYEEGAAACVNASTQCTFDTNTTGPATSFSKNDIEIGTHSLRCTTTGLAADGVTALQSKTTTRIPPPQCRLNPNYGEF